MIYHFFYYLFLLLYIPEEFAHGFLVMSEEAEFVYKCTNFRVCFKVFFMIKCYSTKIVLLNI